jgi:propanediol dehydratase small subunit
MERAVRQDLTPADLRIHPDTLRHQAAVAEEGGNPQLAANLRRAAELTAIDDEELIAVYEALRPMRSSLSQLEAIALRLETVNAVACASLVREAAAYYKTRGLLKLL